MAKSCLGNSDDGLTFWLAEEKDYDEVMGISDNIYRGNDYLPHRYHSWMSEPGRVVMLARRGDKLVALESGLLVDDGRTVVVEGLRVCPSERGRGVAGVIQRFLDDYIQKLHPSIRLKRLTRGVEPEAERLAQFTLLAKRAVLSLVGEAVNFHSITFYLKNKLHSSTGTGSDTCKSVPHLVPLDDEQLRKVLLDPDLPSRAQLEPGTATCKMSDILVESPPGSPPCPPLPPAPPQPRGFDPSKLYAKIKLDLLYGRLWRSYQGTSRARSPDPPDPPGPQQPPSPPQAHPERVYSLLTQPRPSTQEEVTEPSTEERSEVTSEPTTPEQAQGSEVTTTSSAEHPEEQHASDDVTMT